MHFDVLTIVNLADNHSRLEYKQRICWLANGTKVKHFRRDSSKAQAVPLADVVRQLCQNY